jgi:O-acetyl-ADP-ribose deacetylase (regulator of RNase III)
MPTVFMKGDIFNTDGLKAFAHGVNCAGAMDSGVSVAFKKRWPEMFAEYHARCEDKRFQLGDVFVWSGGEETVYGLGIQEHWKKKSNLPALSRALKKMIELATASGIDRIGLPRIGAGLGGLDWVRVRRILEEAGAETRVTLLVFEQFVRGGHTIV